MKRLWIAVALLAVVATLCVITHLYQHHRIDEMLHHLDRLETLYRQGDPTAADEAEEFHQLYGQVCNRISSYVPHGELRESRETAALLATLMRDGNEEECYMELARMRAQLEGLRRVDDLILHNIL